MGSRKKGSELVFNLQWRNKPDHGGDKSNIVGMYDIPATTHNFETFKSYLLKNSGVVGNDVKVTYLTDNGAEWVINSQESFEIALCAFRLKARLGEVIFLKLDKISGFTPNPHMMRKHAETQFDHDSTNNSFDAPPEWFLAYMKQFKRDVIEEVTYTVSCYVTPNSKEKESVSPVVVVPKKVKPESTKRSRKHMTIGENPIDKDLFKTLKYDRKIEIKLDKLDAKTKKIKEKKQALISKIESDVHRDGNRHVQVPATLDGTSLMNATLVAESTVIPHMVGGETYMHTWEVMNNGKLPWTSKTELRLTWGSADMKPSTNVIRCPLLQPGQKGSICICFHIPKKPGNYESYWNFYDRDVRFGHWVSCCVIVDDPPISSYIVENAFSKKPKIEQEQQQTVVTRESEIPEKPSSPKQFVPQKNVLVIQETPSGSELEGAAARLSSNVMDSGRITNNVIDLSRRFHEIQIDSDSDWESLGSYNGLKRQKSAEENIVEVEQPPSSKHSINEMVENVAVEAELSFNKYGINEKDLIVDLSTSNKEIQEETSEENKTQDNVQKTSEKHDEELINISDDNNNNGNSVNNNSSGESICEIASEASDLSSGYDIITSPVCEEKEEASGYVYITIDGNKLPVPKHILRPDFLAEVEEAPGPINSEEEEKTVARNSPVEETPPCKEKTSEEQQPDKILQYTTSFVKSMQSSTANSCLSEFSPGQHTRVFIFPQDNPGFEVLYYPKGVGDGSQNEPTPPRSLDRIVYYPDGIADGNGSPTDAPKEVVEENYVNNPSNLEVQCENVTTIPDKAKSAPTPTVCFPKGDDTQAEGVSCPTSTADNIPDDLTQNYTWAHSDTQYTFPDIQAACAASAGHLKCDPYGPLEQSRPTSSQSNAPGQNQNFQHVPNYQQSFSKGYYRCNRRTPTAPPQQQATQNNSATQPTVPPVHILPENLVSGAVNVASSAINTARSVISMIVPPKTEGGKWVNGHWVTDNPQSVRAKNICILADMGFWDTDLNATLLARYNDDVSRVVSELLQ